MSPVNLRYTRVLLPDENISPSLQAIAPGLRGIPTFRSKTEMHERMKPVLQT